MTFLNAKNTLCSAKLNITYSGVLAGKNSLFSVQDIEDALNAGIRKAWDYKIWPFAEIKATATGTWNGTTNPLIIAQSVFEGLQGQSMFLAVVNKVPWIGETAGKRNFTDFMKWFADYPSDNSKLWAEFSEEFYFNPLAFSANAYTIDLYGKEHAPSYNTGSDTFTDSSALPFTYESTGTDTESSGNEAIILFAYAYLLAGEKKKNAAQATAEEKKAYAILDLVWAPIAEGRSQNSPQNRPMFNVDDLFSQGNRPNRTNTNIGNFP